MKNRRSPLVSVNHVFSSNFHCVIATGKRKAKLNWHRQTFGELNEFWIRNCHVEV